MFFPCCSSGGKRPASDHVDSGDTEPESDPLIEGEIPGWQMSWVLRAGGTTSNSSGYYEDRGIAVAALPDGSTYVTGYFSGTATFGEGEPGETTLTKQGGTCDGFVARYSPYGKLIWARQIGTPGMAEGLAVAVLGDGGGLVTGRTEAETTFFAETEEETTLTGPSGLEHSFYMVRFDKDGRLLWVASGGSPDCSSVITDVEVVNNAILVTGIFQDQIIINEGTENEEVIESNGERDVFLARVSLDDGIVEWFEKAGGIDNDFGSGISICAGSSVALVGHFSDSPTLGADQPNETVLNGDRGLILAMYNMEGALVWARVGVEGIVQHTHVRSITCSPDGERLIISTAFSGEAVIGAGTKFERVLTTAAEGEGILLASYRTSNGALEWVTRAEWTGEGHSNLVVDSIDVSPEGRIALSGSYEGGLVFGPGESKEKVLQKNTAAGKDMFLALFEDDGSLEWATSYNGDKPGEDYPDSVVFHGEHTLFVTGRFCNEMVFGTCADDAVVLEANGNIDMFLMRLDETEPPT